MAAARGHAGGGPGAPTFPEDPDSASRPRRAGSELSARRVASFSFTGADMAAVKTLNPKAEVARAQAALAVNISAARGLQDVLRTNLGPKGTMKMAERASRAAADLAAPGPRTRARRLGAPRPPLPAPSLCAAFPSLWGFRAP
ncbi:hypothetical protein P7K49_004285 [Saguinus oedipus]|uniref:Uncharacterized protein n=1 Tax=Saguinus oedipus TaxID=9490 RepID=A0ABQ9W8I1_SAGOE|nr:hypothetical protein P7K49_004285 [Saguinus oedipus]